MEIRIRPEPEDRDAVLAAVEELLARDSLPPAYSSGWRQRAIRENVEFSERYGEAVRPRSSPGATRA
ncbi:MAG TPA: hypothetical protein VGP56_10230 [Gaiellaceae bacterium]|jgi:hypothetical protein|nr:hypothetical protein [Gaiellaceae bacterium]